MWRGRDVVVSYNYQYFDMLIAFFVLWCRWSGLHEAARTRLPRALEYQLTTYIFWLGLTCKVTVVNCDAAYCGGRLSSAVNRCRCRRFVWIVLSFSCSCWRLQNANVYFSWWIFFCEWQLYSVVWIVTVSLRNLSFLVRHIPAVDCVANNHHIYETTVCTIVKSQV